MPIYTVQDNETGRIVKFEWLKSSPPTEKDYAEIRAEAFKAKPTYSGLPAQPPEPFVPRPTPSTPTEVPAGGLFGLLGALGIKEKVPPPTPPTPGQPLATGEVTDPGLLGTLTNPAEIATMIATGGISAARLGKPIIKEMVDWGLYGAPSIAKGIRGGVSGLLTGLGAKAREAAIPVEKAAPLVVRAEEIVPSSAVAAGAKPIAEGISKVAPTPRPIAPTGATEAELRAPWGGRFEPSIEEAQQTTKQMSGWRDDIKKIFAPSTRGPEAKFTAETIREEAARMSLSYTRAQKALSDARTYFSKAGEDSSLKFIYRMERGEPQANPTESSVSKTLKSMTDAKWEEVKSLAPGKAKGFIEDYFPHIWSDPERAAQIFKRRSLAGKPTFLYERDFRFVSEGIDAGLKPKFTNPIDSELAKLHEMNKFLMAHRSMDAIKDAGYLKFVRVGHDGPEGFVKIADPISRVTFKDPKTGNFLTSGHYWAPEPVARLFNNYLSPGLNQYTAFRAYREAANSLNQFQLGFSAFHAGFTSMDTMISKMALGLNQLSHGDIIKAGKSFILTPISSVHTAIKGDRLLRAALDPNKYPEMSPFVEALISGGGRVKMDEFYRTRITTNMMDAFRQGGVKNILSGVLRIPGATVETAMKPILEDLVPRQKLGVFYDLMKYELERNPSMTHEEIRGIATKIVDSIDNRLGQLTYDNMFWNKAGKDLGMASVRSLGWNIGTWREIGGAGLDTAKFVTDIAKGKTPEFSYRMAYTVALPVTVGVAGGTLNYLMTGEAPQSLEDYYFPRTGRLDRNGNPERLSLPSYIKDIRHYYKDPANTVLNKMHPVINTIGEMLHNKDFYGTEIRHKDSHLVQQALQIAEYGAQSFTPLSFRGASVMGQTGDPLLYQALPFVGITPAPLSVSKTPAQDLAAEYVARKMPIGGRTKEEADRRDLMISLSNRKRLGENVSADAVDAYRSGKITKKMFHEIMIGSPEPLLRHFNALRLDEAQNVYDKANEEEKTKLLPMLNRKKISEALKYSPEAPQRQLNMP